MSLPSHGAVSNIGLLPLSIFKPKERWIWNDLHENMKPPANGHAQFDPPVSFNMDLHSNVPRSIEALVSKRIIQSVSGLVNEVVANEAKRQVRIRIIGALRFLFRYLFQLYCLCTNQYSIDFT